jgi:hypothetical protein
VYYFLEDNVTVGIITKVGVSKDSLEVSAVAVDVAGYYQITTGRQTDKIIVSVFVGIVGLDAFFQQIFYRLRHKSFELP